MTTSHIEMPERYFGLSRGESGEVLITASDPEQPDRLVNIVARNSFTDKHGFGFGPVFSLSVVPETALA